MPITFAEERCDDTMKRTLLNAAPGSLDGLQRCRRLGRQTGTMHRFFRLTGLRVS